jgi:hypothetical protein
MIMQELLVSQGGGNEGAVRKDPDRNIRRSGGGCVVLDGVSGLTSTGFRQKITDGLHAQCPFFDMGHMA